MISTWLPYPQMRTKWPRFVLTTVLGVFIFWNSCLLGIHSQLRIVQRPSASRIPQGQKHGCQIELISVRFLLQKSLKQFYFIRLPIRFNTRSNSIENKPCQQSLKHSPFFGLELSIRMSEISAGILLKLSFSCIYFTSLFNRQSFGFFFSCWNLCPNQIVLKSC